MWFEELTGFKEGSPQNVRKNLTIEGEEFISTAHNRRFAFGKLEILTLGQLKRKSPPREVFRDRIRVNEIVADAQELHIQIENENALFQAASQFNLLEMVGPHVTPENGIDRYENDYTQGPVCAIACGAGTIYRNYFVEIGDQIGQSHKQQIDCLDLIGKSLENEKFNFWTMQNGYAMFEQKGLLALNKRLASLTQEDRELLKDQLKTGIQWNTEVTKSISKHKVSQIYCSALPVAYCRIDSIYWENFARIILEATYESTLHTAMINYDKNNSDKVFLTLVGGGAFGNEEHWIVESMQKAIRKFKNTPLDVKIVSYGQSNHYLLQAISEI